MPWAAKPAVLDRALAEGAALMWAPVVEGGVLPFESRHAHGRVSARHRHGATVGEFLGVEDLDPIGGAGMRIGHAYRWARVSVTWRPAGIAAVMQSLKFEGMARRGNRP